MLSETIKVLRRKHYLNQTAFANMIGVTQSAISQWEHGLTKPNSEQLRAISHAFGVSVDDLLSGEEKDPAQGPRTPEARIVSAGMDKLPKDQREKILNVLRAMFASDLFDGGNDE